jgi:hypothetical protein
MWNNFFIKISIIFLIVFISCQNNKERKVIEDNVKYTLLNTEYYYIGDSLYRGKINYSNIEISIKNSHKDSTIMVWHHSFLRPMPDSLITEIKRISKDTLEIYSKYDIIYSINNDAQVIKILNFDEIKNYFSYEWKKEFKDDINKSPLSKKRIIEIENIFLNDSLIYYQNFQLIDLLHFPKLLSIKENNISCTICDSTYKDYKILNTYENEIHIELSYEIDKLFIDDFMTNSLTNITSNIEEPIKIQVIDTIRYNLQKDLLRLPNQIEFWRTIKTDEVNKFISYSFKREDFIIME